MEKNRNKQQLSCGRDAEKKQALIARCYACYVENGLENTTTRDLAAAAGVNINTLYYYFNSKAGILLQCVDYGFSLLGAVLFRELNQFEQTSFDIFPDILRVGIDFAPQMRFLVQAVASPTFENHREDQLKKVNALYDRLGMEMAELFGCPHEMIKGSIQEMMTLVSYYSLWGSREMAAMQFSKIFGEFKTAVTNYRQVLSLSEPGKTD